MKYMFIALKICQARTGGTALPITLYEDDGDNGKIKLSGNV